jgi:hypothetical protein
MTTTTNSSSSSLNNELSKFIQQQQQQDNSTTCKPLNPNIVQIGEHLYKDFEDSYNHSTVYTTGVQVYPIIQQSIENNYKLITSKEDEFVCILYIYCILFLIHSYRLYQIWS